MMHSLRRERGKQLLEVQVAMLKRKNGKSPGTCRISAETLKAGKSG